MAGAGRRAWGKYAHSTRQTDNPTIPDKIPRKYPQVEFCRVSSGCQVGVREKVADSGISSRNEKLDTGVFEERAAICEYDGGLSRADAEQVSAEC